MMKMNNKIIVTVITLFLTSVSNSNQDVRLEFTSNTDLISPLYSVRTHIDGGAELRLLEPNIRETIQNLSENEWYTVYGQVSPVLKEQGNDSPLPYLIQSEIHFGGPGRDIPEYITETLSSGRLRIRKISTQENTNFFERIPSDNWIDFIQLEDGIASNRKTLNISFILRENPGIGNHEPIYLTRLLANGELALYTIDNNERQFLNLNKDLWVDIGPDSILNEGLRAKLIGADIHFTGEQGEIPVFASRTWSDNRIEILSFSDEMIDTIMNLPEIDYGGWTTLFPPSSLGRNTSSNRVPIETRLHFSPINVAPKYITRAWSDGSINIRKMPIVNEFLDFLSEATNPNTWWEFVPSEE